MSNDKKQAEEAARKALEELARKGGPRIMGNITSGGNVNIGQTIIVNNNKRK